MKPMKLRTQGIELRKILKYPFPWNYFNWKSHGLSPMFFTHLKPQDTEQMRKVFDLITYKGKRQGSRQINKNWIKIRKNKKEDRIRKGKQMRSKRNQLKYGIEEKGF